MASSLSQDDVEGEEAVIKTRLEYQRMEKISNEIFLILDEDGGGGLDKKEFVEGLLGSESIWTKFAAVNPIQRCKAHFAYLTPPGQSSPISSNVK